MHWLIEDMVMKLLPTGDEERVSYCCWGKKPGIKDWAAVVFKDPSGLSTLCNFLSGFEELMKKYP
jgi:hypothetical protein